MNTTLDIHTKDDSVCILAGIIETSPHTLVSGPTGSGKTTLLNRAIRKLSQNLRVLIIDGGFEFDIKQKRHLSIEQTDRIDAEPIEPSYIDASIKHFSPDIILVGEVNVKNAAKIWEIAATQSLKIVGTIYGHTPENAARNFVSNILSAKNHFPQDFRTLKIPSEGEILASFKIAQIHNSPHEGVTFPNN